MKSAHRPRRYTLGARAASAAETQRAVLDAAIQTFGQRDYEQVSLADVARVAGVAVQTVLRKFGSKEALTTAAVAHGVEDVREARLSSAPGDLDAAVRGLVEHYEAWGDRSLLFLSQEGRVAAMKQVTDAGRAVHHAWVDHAFGPWLAKARGAGRARLRSQLIATTDVYVWKILRHDLGLGARACEVTLRELVAAVVA